VDDASLTVRGAIIPRRTPLRVVFSRQGGLAPSLALVRSAGEVRTLVITEAHRPSTHLAELAEAGVEVVWVGSLAEGLAALRQRGVGSILVEGGGRLAGALLSAGLVDRYYWIQSPVWLGESGVPAVSGLTGSTLVEAERWQVVERRALGQDTLLVVDREPCLPES
jgi:diaminohydroxyphosphoribosylaminopyrimidine deaminase/5-amino-6-(5-phosphoribosylamino)uracil reductase